MKRQYGLEELQPDGPSVVTTGIFDGVHRGHQAILEYLLERAAKRGGRSVVLTFDPHPREVIGDGSVPLLMTIEERAASIDAMGVDRFVILPFTKALSRLSAEEFVEDILIRRIGLREIVIGPGHAFGRDRKGNAELLEALGKRRGFSVDVIPPRIVGEHVVSSSAIRQLLEEDGDVAAAKTMLGRPYGFAGTVVRGEGRGRALGFPTANVVVEDPRKVMPALGVYVVQVLRDASPSGKALPGMMNIGHSPTFGGVQRTIEVHIPGFRGNLYGERLRMEFVLRMRDERRFASKTELAEQLSKDRLRCMELLGKADAVRHSP